MENEMGLVGFEPTSHDLKDRCLLPLGHRPITAGRAGFEPAISALKELRLDLLPNAPSPQTTLIAGLGNAPSAPGL
jgi:hypothetical protein